MSKRRNSTAEQTTDVTGDAAPPTAAPPAVTDPSAASEPIQTAGGDENLGAPVDKLRNLPAKWGAEAIKAGWVALPSIVLERQAALGLDAIDINIILHVAKHWFEPANLPHPSKGSIAKAMQLAPRTVQKHISKLHSLGFMKRIERRGLKGSRGSQTSQFDFVGLADKIKPFAIEELQMREENRQRRLEQLRRKRPRVAASASDAA